MDYKDIEQFSLAQFRDMLMAEFPDQMSVFFGNSIGVAYRVRPKFVSKFLGQPHIFPEMRLLQLRRGSARGIINLVERTLVVGDVVFVRSNSIVNIVETSPDIEVTAVTLTDEQLALALAGHAPDAFDGHVQDFVLHPAAPDFDLMDRIIHLIYISICQEAASSHMLMSLFAALLWHVNRLWALQQQSGRSAETKEQKILSAFLASVNRHCRAHHTIDYYAAEQFLSPRYFGSLIKRVSGRGAKDWIDEALATAIKVELQHTDKPLKLIAAELAFPNLSFFCKYFRRLTGLTPVQYRQSVSADAAVPSS